MRRFFILILVLTLHAPFLHATEKLFKFTFGTNQGSVPFEINKTNINIKKSPGIKLNSWILTPNFSSFLDDKKKSKFSKKKNSKDDFYIKFKLKF